MKIVCLIRPYPPLIYFVNKINSEYPVSLVVIENINTTSLNIFSKIKKHGIRGSIKILKNRILKRADKAFDYNAFFGNEWQALNENLAYLETDSVNSIIVFNRLKEVKPDLILDHGTSIVKDHILETSKLALNLHWGLSPYYRGVHCTEWALINWDPYNIGVTIHKLTKYIDGGSIVAQKRVQIKPDDNVESINMQLTLKGTELILNIIKKINDGEYIEFINKNFLLGYLTLHRQWNCLLGKEIKYILKNNLIELMLKKPSRLTLPIIEIKL